MLTAKEAKEQKPTVEQIKESELLYANYEISKAVKNGNDETELLINTKVVDSVIQDLKNLEYQVDKEYEFSNEITRLKVKW